MMARRPVLLSALLMTLAGCAGHAPAPRMAEQNPVTAPAASVFAEQVAMLSPGQARTFTGSPFGPAMVEAGASYVSGLGNECRAARVRPDMGVMRAFAVCRAPDGGAWKVVPSIFEDVPR